MFIVFLSLIRLVLGLRSWRVICRIHPQQQTHPEHPKQSPQAQSQAVPSPLHHPAPPRPAGGMILSVPVEGIHLVRRARLLVRRVEFELGVCWRVWRLWGVCCLGLGFCRMRVLFTNPPVLPHSTPSIIPPIHPSRFTHGLPSTYQALTHLPTHSHIHSLDLISFHLILLHR